MLGIGSTSQGNVNYRTAH